MTAATPAGVVFPLEDIVEVLLLVPELRVKTQVHLDSATAALYVVTLLGALSGSSGVIGLGVVWPYLSVFLLGFVVVLFFRL